MKNKLVDTAPHFISIDKTCQSGSCMYVCMYIRSLRNYVYKYVQCTYISLKKVAKKAFQENKQWKLNGP